MTKVPFSDPTWHSQLSILRVPIYPVASAPAGARHHVEHMHTHRQTLIHKHNPANYICIFDGGIFNPNLIASFLWTNKYMCFSKCPLGVPLIMHFIFFLYKNTKIHTFSKNRFISFSNLFKPLIPVIPACNAFFLRNHFKRKKLHPGVRLQVCFEA